MSRCLKYPAVLIQLFILMSIAALATAANAATNPPVLISDSVSTRAIAFESVTMKPEPFALTPAMRFSADNRTRVTIFAMNLDLLADEIANGNPSAFTADAEDASNKHYPLTVEYAGAVPPAVDAKGNITTDFRGIYMIVVRLSDAMGDLGDVLLRLNLHGLSSNRVRIALGHLGGGPVDDPGAVPTPAPPVPPPPTTPLTIDQFRNQFSNPALAAGPDALRFLEQATWGPSDAELTRVRSMGYVNWIADQFTNQPPLFSQSQSNYPTLDLYPTDGGGCPQGSPESCIRDHYTMFPLQSRFYQNAVARPDQLRQRVAFALHQLIPVSGMDLNNQPAWVGPYLQILDRNAFGNFRQLLYDITLNPGMGDYLNMKGNSRINPNENYAREIMQLFSVGVDLLNQDGTPVLDAQGNRTPTYDQSTITNFARVFTGWDLGPSKTTNINGVDTQVLNYIDSMVLSNNTNRYDVDKKTLLNGLVLPACSDCANAASFQAYKNNELNLAIDNLFNHQNTGPYLCTQLIHQLVTSNPSPAYVGRCAAAFSNNGSSVRGELKAVIAAILLDPEARGDAKTDPNYGHLREPVLFVNNVLRAFNGFTDGNLTTSTVRQGLMLNMGQDLFNPPTVFSYYPADFGLAGTNMLAAEFGILSTQTAFQRANFVNTLFIGANGKGGLFPPESTTGTQCDISTYTNLGGNPQQLVDALNTKLMHNTMSQAMKNAIVTNLSNLNLATPSFRAQTAIYLVLTSSQYQVER